jgi:hypothetical protein
MIGDVAAAVGVQECYACTRQIIFAGDEVFHVPVAAERDGVGMFHDEQLVGDFAALALLDQRALPFKGFAVIHAPQVAPETATH